MVTQAIHTCPCPSLASWRQVATHFSASLPKEKKVPRGARLCCLGAFVSCLGFCYLASSLGILPSVLIHIIPGIPVVLVHDYTGDVVGCSVLVLVAANLWTVIPKCQVPFVP